jgi:hypothetical protein
MAPGIAHTVTSMGTRDRWLSIEDPLAGWGVASSSRPAPAGGLRPCDEPANGVLGVARVREPVASVQMPHEVVEGGPRVRHVCLPVGLVRDGSPAAGSTVR